MDYNNIIRDYRKFEERRNVMCEQMSLKTITTTFDIINILIELDGAGVTELASRMEKPTSTVHEYLNALNEEGYVIKKGQNYRVSSRFLYLGHRVRSQRKIYTASRDQIQNLATKTGEYASLVVEEQGYGVLLYNVPGEEAVEIDTPDGIRTSLHSMAPGKCILAHLPDDRVEEIIRERGLKSRTQNTITEKSELFDELEMIRDQGYAIDHEEQFEGMQGIGAPILDLSENIRGALSVYGPVGRIKNQQQNLLEIVSETVNVIEVSLKYPSDYP